MKKYLLPTMIICIALFMLAACSDKDDTEDNDSNENNETEEVDSEEENKAESSEDATEDATEEATEDATDESDEEEFDIEELSERMVEALDDRDMEFVAKYVHPEKGLLFSPYVYVMDEAVVLNENEVASMMDSDEIYEWGTYDGKGSPIDLTPTAYMDDFMDMTPFLDPDELLIDDLKERGNTLNNVNEVFPDAQVIEYYNDGSEEYAGIDWSSILFVYETDEAGSLQLVALIRDMWTI